MDINQKLDFFKKALDMGADVVVKFHFISGKKEAERIANVFSEMLGIPYDYNERDGAFWLRIRDVDKGIDITVFYEYSNEEKKEMLQQKIDELKNELEELS